MDSYQSSENCSTIAQEIVPDIVPVSSCLLNVFFCSEGDPRKKNGPHFYHDNESV